MANVYKILREIGARVQNAGGSIDSEDNMFRGSHAEQPYSDQAASLLGKSGNRNPLIKKEDEGQTDTNSADVLADNGSTEKTFSMSENAQTYGGGHNGVDFSK